MFVSPINCVGSACRPSPRLAAADPGSGDSTAARRLGCPKASRPGTSRCTCRGWRFRSPCGPCSRRRGHPFRRSPPHPHSRNGPGKTSPRWTAAVLHNVDCACVAAGHDDRALADGYGLGVANVRDLAFPADVQPMCAVSDALDLGRADVGVDPLQDRGAGGPDVGAEGVMPSVGLVRSYRATRCWSTAVNPALTGLGQRH